MIEMINQQIPTENNFLLTNFETSLWKVLLNLQRKGFHYILCFSIYTLICEIVQCSETQKNIYTLVQKTIILKVSKHELSGIAKPFYDKQQPTHQCTTNDTSF